MKVAAAAQATQREAQLLPRRLQIRFIARMGRRLRDCDCELAGIYDGERAVCAAAALLRRRLQRVDR